MRCMTCGEHMVLADVKSAEAGLVKGFENQVLLCPGCGATECRFVFASAVTNLVDRVSETTTPASDWGPVCNGSGADDLAVYQESSIKLFSATTEEESSASVQQTEFASVISEKLALAPARARNAQQIRTPAGTNHSGKAWQRALEKFRSYQADARRRAAKANVTVDFIDAWNKPTMPRRKRSASAQPRATSGAELHTQPLRLAGDRARPVAAHPSEAMRRFDELWDGLGPSHRLPHNALELSVSVAPLAPLPRSLSLVTIEPIATHKYIPKITLEKLFHCIQGALPADTT